MTLTWKAAIDYCEKSIGAYDEEEGSYENPKSNFDYLALLQGKPYPSGMDIPSIYFVNPAKKLLLLDCLWLVGGIPLVSRRLADFIRSHVETEIELIKPTAIYAAGTDFSHDYEILNPIQTVNAIDIEKSEAKLDNQGRIIYFKSKFIRDDSMTSHDIAREIQSLDLLVSERLAQKLNAEDFKVKNGINFYKLQRRLIPYSG